MRGLEVFVLSSSRPKASYIVMHIGVLASSLGFVRGSRPWALPGCGLLALLPLELSQPADVRQCVDPGCLNRQKIAQRLVHAVASAFA